MAVINQEHWLRKLTASLSIRISLAFPFLREIFFVCILYILLECCRESFEGGCRLWY